MIIASAKINVARIEKVHLFEGKNGKYLDIVLVENKGGPDQFGNDGFVAQGISKEAKAAGGRGPIIGNWRRIGAAKQRPAADPELAPAKQPDEDDVPF